MIVYKIFHIPSGKYLQNSLDYGNALAFPLSVKQYFKLGKKGKSWNTKKAVLNCDNNDLEMNCDVLKEK